MTCYLLIFPCVFFRTLLLSTVRLKSLASLLRTVGITHLAEEENAKRVLPVSMANFGAMRAINLLNTLNPGYNKSFFFLLHVKNIKAYLFFALPTGLDLKLLLRMLRPRL